MVCRLGGRRAAGRHDLQRHVPGSVLGRRLALRGGGGRVRLVARDAHPVLAAAVSLGRSSDVWHQRVPLHPAQEGAGLAGSRAEDRERHGISDGAPRGAGRRVAAPDRRVPALRAQPRIVHRARVTGRSVQRRCARVCRSGSRHQVPRQQQPVGRRDDQSGLRSSRSRSGGGEPLSLRDVLRGEAPVLHRGRERLQQLRTDRRQQFLGLQPRRADRVLLAANRPVAAGGREWRLRRRADGHDDSRRREADREDAQGLEPGPARCGDRARARGDGHRPGQRDHGSRAALELLRRPCPARDHQARRHRCAGDGGDPRSFGAVAARRAPGSGLRCRRRRPLLSGREARLGDSRPPHRQPTPGQQRRHHAASGGIAALFRSSGRRAPRARSRRDETARLDRQREPEPAERRARRERLALERQSRVRFERRGVHVHERSGRDARRVSIPEPEGQHHPPQPVPRHRQVLHLELRPRAAIGRPFHTRQRAVQELLDRVRQRGLLQAGPGRPRDARRAVDGVSARAQPVCRRGKRRPEAHQAVGQRRLRQQRCGRLEPELRAQSSLHSRRIARDLRAARVFPGPTRSRSTSIASSIRSRPRPSARDTCSRP